MYLTSLTRQDLAWSPWRSSFCKASSPQQCNVFGAGLAVVYSLRWKAASECENRVFILINIFIERKLSPGSICLLILIYPVSLNGFCTGKETVQPLDRDDRARREGWFFRCMWASVLEASTKLCDDYMCSISRGCLQIFDQRNWGRYLPWKCLWQIALHHPKLAKWLLW